MLRPHPVIAMVCAAGLAALQPLALPQRSLAQACPCGCAQPSVGYLRPDGGCQCPCTLLPSPGMTEETLGGPPKPPKAGGGDDVHWQFEDVDADDWPFWGLW
ncbi:MAG: hypothetical protein WAM11_10750 [Cyanobium sp.]